MRQSLVRHVRVLLHARPSQAAVDELSARRRLGYQLRPDHPWATLTSSAPELVRPVGARGEHVFERARKSTG